MISRITAVSIMLGAMFFVTGFATPGYAAVKKKVFDTTEMRWVMVEPDNRRVTKKKPPAKFNRRNVTITTSLPVGTIIVNTDEKFLYYITGDKKAVRYGVGVGREGFTWSGTADIKRKVEWPSWTPPAAMRAREAAKGHILPVTMKGGINNPLGARALYLYQGGRDTLYRLHGTGETWSIGLNVSSGCIRLLNKDVEDLYKRAKLGTKVVVIGPGEDSSKYYSENKNPFAALFGS